MSPVELAILRARIEAIPKKKQQKWHAAAKNEEGTLRQLRFFNGDFQIKVLASSTHGKCLIPASGWAPIVESGKNPSMKQIEDAYGESAVKALEELIDARIGGTHTMNSPSHQRVQEAGLRNEDYQAWNLEMMRVMNEHHTGKHHRNKALNVPTMPGQPVRG